MNITITLEIPALDRYTAALDRYTAAMVAANAGNVVPLSKGASAIHSKDATTPAPAASPKKAEKPAKAATPPAPEEEAPTDEHTIASLTARGKALIAISSPAALRAALDAGGLKGRKLGDAKESEFQAISDAIEAAIAENDLG